MVCTLEVGCKCISHTNPNIIPPPVVSVDTSFVTLKTVTILDSGNPYTDFETFDHHINKDEDLYERGCMRMRRALQFQEDFLKRGKAQWKTKAREGEEPLSPWVIEFTRKILNAFMSMALPHIAGYDVCDIYQRQLMKQFKIQSVNKAGMIIMARGFGKSESMRASAATLVLCSTVNGTIDKPYRILCISNRKPAASILMRLILKTIWVLHKKYVSSIEVLCDNAEEKIFCIDGHRYVELKSVACTHAGIRSNHPDMVIFDECMFANYEVMMSALMPIVLEPNCRSMFASTPAEAGSREDMFLKEIQADYEEQRGIFVPVYLGMVCANCKKKSPLEQSKCRHEFSNLQPWRPVQSFLPAVLNATDIMTVLAEYMGQPPSRIGACFDADLLWINRGAMPDRCDLHPAREIIVSIDPTHNGRGGKTKDGKDSCVSKFAIISFTIAKCGRLCFLGFTNVHIGKNGTTASLAYIRMHLAELAASFEHYNECRVVVTIEGNNPAISQDIAREVDEYYRINHRFEKKVVFMRNNEGDPYMAATRFQRQAAVIAIEHILERRLMFPHKNMFGDPKGWSELFDQLGALEDDGKHISGKAAGSQDDLAMAFLNAVGILNIRRDPYMLEEELIDFKMKKSSTGRKRSRIR